MLKERDSETLREVDILIEVPAADNVLRMAVECRDHARPADVGWIDGLIGKYRDLPVHSVVAVSRTGFTSAAAQKALANRIETRSLREALAEDWTKSFGVGIARLSAELIPTQFQITTDPPWPDARQPIAIEVDGTKKTSDEWLRGGLAVLRGQLPDVVHDRLGGNWKALAESDRKIEIEWSLRSQNTIFIAESGTRHALGELLIRCKIVFGHEWLPVKREMFGNVGIASALDTTTSDDPLAVMLVQQQGHLPSEVVVFRSNGTED